MRGKDGGVGVWSERNMVGEGKEEQLLDRRWEDLCSTPQHPARFAIFLPGISLVHVPFLLFKQNTRHWIAYKEKMFVSQFCR